MAAIPLGHFEVPIGAIDGVNTYFTTPGNGYKATTLVVFLNGVLQQADLDDGWVEDIPQLGTFHLKQAPIDGDRLQVFFIDSFELYRGTAVDCYLSGLLIEQLDFDATECFATFSFTEEALEVEGSFCEQQRIEAILDDEPDAVEDDTTIFIEGLLDDSLLEVDTLFIEKLFVEATLADVIDFESPSPMAEVPGLLEDVLDIEKECCS